MSRSKPARPRVAIQPNNCAINEHTADGASVGRCWHWLGDGSRRVCPLHGDVTEAQARRRHRDDVWRVDDGAVSTRARRVGVARRISPEQASDLLTLIRLAREAAVYGLLGRVPVATERAS